MRKVNPIERPKTLKELAYKEVKYLLTTGQLEFDKIHSTNQFSDALGVSRTPVREALIQLTMEGHLTFIQGRGFKIKEFSEKETKDFFETRKMIETYVIERLVGVVTERDVQQLDHSLKLMAEKAKEGDMRGLVEADKDFHMYLVRRYANLFLESVIESIRNYISIFGEKVLSREGRTEEVINEHKIILQALRQKDKKGAVEAVVDHLNTTEKYVLEYFERVRR